MTIACCYVSPEGVILGADSTASYGGGTAGLHYYNHNQKVFELGNDATLGIVTWGMGALAGHSYRTLFAKLSDQFAAGAPPSVSDAIGAWIDLFWPLYDAALNAATAKPMVDICRALATKGPYGSATPQPPAGLRTEKEEETFQKIIGELTAGFCLGGYVMPSREPAAYKVQFTPLMIAKPTASPVPTPGYEFWGAPNIMQRLLFGADDATKKGIMESGKWTGTIDELNVVFTKNSLGHPIIPLRDAVDFVYTCVYSTIKALKFSHFPQICGGPIELCVISTDRKFRWVRHKAWDAAIADGATT